MSDSASLVRLLAVAARAGANMDIARAIGAYLEGGVWGGCRISSPGTTAEADFAAGSRFIRDEHSPTAAGSIGYRIVLLVIEDLRDASPLTAADTEELSEIVRAARPYAEGHLTERTWLNYVGAWHAAVHHGGRIRAVFTTRQLDQTALTRFQDGLDAAIMSAPRAASGGERFVVHTMLYPDTPASPPKFNQTDADVMHELEFGESMPIHEAYARVGSYLSGLFSVWIGEQLLYIGSSAYRSPRDKQITTLHTVLAAIERGSRLEHELCLRLFDRLILKTLTDAERSAIIEGRLDPDRLVQALVVGRLTLRIAITKNDNDAARLLDVARSTLGAGARLLD